MTDYPRIETEILTMEKAVRGYIKVSLACGHDTSLEEIDGQAVHVTSGARKGSVWVKWEGTVHKVGDLLTCHHCQKAEKTRIIQAREPKPIEQFESRDLMLEAHPNSRCHQYGPLHKHEGVLYVQTYLGQHEWVAFLASDTRVCHEDPGWVGTMFGYGWLSEDDFMDGTVLGQRDTLPPPESEGEPTTVDQILFGTK
mgnify:CR=1 FL=1